MSSVFVMVACGLSFFGAWCLTWALRRYALARKVLDVPNERSSHQIPTPRGGGVAFVITFLIMVAIFGLSVGHGLGEVIALLGAGILIAVVGALDDHGHIQAGWRLLAHFLGAAWVLFWMGGMPPVALLGIEASPLWLGWGIGGLYLVWLLNLYNFMDGIDGLAGVEAICVSLGGAFLYVLLGHSQQAFLPILLACAVFGFLLWNFPVAKIFMGDAGSGFLGLTLAALSLQAAWVEGQLFWSWLILLGVFIVDATWTLLRRVSRGEKAYQAHRTHAYQYASRRCGRHLPVTLGVLAINVFWLFPLAVLVAKGLLDGFWGLAIAYAPLLWGAIRLGAGRPEDIGNASA